MIYTAVVTVTRIYHVEVEAETRDAAETLLYESEPDAYAVIDMGLDVAVTELQAK